ncbi:uncharacterized protein LOC144097265 [Amblyomma americanum]
MVSRYREWLKEGWQCTRKHARQQRIDARGQHGIEVLKSMVSTSSRHGFLLKKGRRKTCFVSLCSLALLTTIVCVTKNSFVGTDKKHGVPWNPCGGLDRAATPCTNRFMAGELVHCAAPCGSVERERRSLVWRAPRGSNPMQDLQAASYSLAAVLSHPLELHWWPHKAVVPFYGPFLALVSTRPKNAARRQRIRQGWGNATHYPPGAFRLIFFLTAPPEANAKTKTMTEMLLSESNKHLDMAVEAPYPSSTRAMMLEWAPQYAQSTRLVLWARDHVDVEAKGLMKRMLELSTRPGDVFGRVSASAARSIQANDGLEASSPWNQLEMCAYFLKMGALARMSSVYEDEARNSTERDQENLVTPSLAHRANLSLVPIEDFAPCSRQSRQQPQSTVPHRTDGMNVPGTRG